MNRSIDLCDGGRSHLSCESVDFSSIEYQVLPHELIAARDLTINESNIEKKIHLHPLKVKTRAAAFRHV